MRAATYRFRSELRNRWRSWLALAILVGAVAGASLMLFAGARRTGSAHDRFRSAQRAFDVGLEVSCGHGAAPAQDGDTSCFDDIGRLPAVGQSTTITELGAFIETLDGQSIQPNPDDPCDSNSGVVRVMYDASGRYGTTINRSRFVEGRPANPAAADEVVVSQYTAERLGLHSGSRLRIRLFGESSCEERPDEWRAPALVRVVGVQLSPAEIRPPSGEFLQSVRVTPAFVRNAGAVPDRSDYLAVRIRPGSSVNELRAQAGKAGHEVMVGLSQDAIARAVDREVRPSQVSLQILAALTALAGVAVLGQILVRQAFVEADDDATLSALGMSRRERVVLAALRSGAVGVGAAVVAIVTAVATSPLMPIGVARNVEPARGLSVDASVLAIGGIAVVVFVVAISAATAARLAARGVREVRTKRASLASRAAGAGFSPAAVSGLRLALERGAGRTAVPVASSFGGLTIAVVAVVGALTFGAGLTHLQSTPRLIRWNWDFIVGLPALEDPSVLSIAEARVRAERGLGGEGVADFVSGTVWSPFPNGRDLQVGPDRIDVGGFFALDGAARLGPSLISGRKPSASHEILLGPRTLSALRLQVGDEVDVIGQAGTWEGPGEETSTRMTIVGIGLAPMTESLGRGAVVTLEGLRRLSPDATEQAWFVQLSAGGDRAGVVDAYRRAFPRPMRASIESYGREMFDISALNVEQVESLPVLFAAIMGLMAAAVLAHVLTVAGRARRRDIAILRALGFSRGQTLRTIAWQSTIYALGALAIGLPVGILVGRLAWRAYATHLAAVPEAVTPVGACAAVAVAMIALAALLSIVPALRILRTRPGAALRTE